jgi:hypothetical protein
MINVTDSYKLLKIEVDGVERVFKVNTSEAWNVLEVEIDGKTVVINEGDEVKFMTESGSIKTGTVIKLGGKGEKAKITIAPTGINCEETWSVMSITDNQLTVLGEDDENNTEDDE